MSHSLLRLSPLRAVPLALLLYGCASTPPSGWRIEPVARVEHAAPADGRGYVALARQYEGERRWGAALQAYRKAAAEAPADVEVLHALGLTEARHGHAARAVDALRAAVSLAPRRAQLLNNLGYALLLDGRPAEAQAVLHEALAVEPGHARARANLARAVAASRASDGGQARAQAAEAAAPNAPTQGQVRSLSQGQGEDRAPRLSVLAAPNVSALQVHEARPPLAQAFPVRAGLRADTAPDASSPLAIVRPIGAGPVDAGAGDAAHAAVVRAADASAVEHAAAPSAVVRAAGPSAVDDAAAPSAVDRAARAPVAQARQVRVLRLEISNGNGVRGMAGWVGRELGDAGVVGPVRLTNQRPFATPMTRVLYRPGHEAEASRIALLLPVAAEIVEARPGQASDVRVLLGRDALHIAACMTQLPARRDRSAAEAMRPTSPCAIRTAGAAAGGVGER